MMTEEEREELELECASAKLRCKEAWQVLIALEKITKTYFKIHDLWRSRFEKADRKLAMDRPIKVHKSTPKSVLETLTEAQIESIARELMEDMGVN